MDSKQYSRYKYGAKYSVAKVLLGFTIAICLLKTMILLEKTENKRTLFFLQKCFCLEKQQSDIQSIESHQQCKQSKFTVNITIEQFLLYFNATLMLLFVGIFLLIVTVWTFIRKMFVYTYFMQIKMDSIFFILPASLITLPTILLSVLIKSNNRIYMVMLLALEITALILLFTGYFMGMIYQLKFSNETLLLESTLPVESLNHTLHELLLNYGHPSGNSDTFDKIQNKFMCCGVRNVNDFVEVPPSCCPKENCNNFNVWPIGCLRKIREDVAWYKHVTLSLMQLFILMYFFNASMTTCIFVSDHYKWRNKVPTQSKTLIK